MKREYFTLLQGHLNSNVAALQLVDADLGQYQQRGDDHVLTSPAAYLMIRDINWGSLGNKVQRAVMTFDVTLVVQTAYGDIRDHTDNTYINYLAIQSAIYQALKDKRFYIHDVPGMEAVEDTDADAVLIESIDRVDTFTHKNQSNLIVATERYQCPVFDYSATPAYQELMAELELDITIDRNLND
jgi:hypothetical protein